MKELEQVLVQDASHNPLDIISNIKHLMDDEPLNHGLEDLRVM